jgi:hypothetical protein
MRKALLCIAVLLAFGLTAVAQDAGTSGQSSTSTTTTKTTKTKHSKKAAGDMGDMSAKSSTMTGCIEKSGDNYMIKNGRHKKGVKVTGSDDLSAHVGHTVKLTGSWAPTAASTSATGETKGGGAKAGREFNETKVDMVSETCTMGAGKAAAGSSDTSTMTSSTKTKKSKKSTATTPQ